MKSGRIEEDEMILEKFPLFKKMHKIHFLGQQLNILGLEKRTKQLYRLKINQI